ncbi:retrovirus-related Pol polyprotein LINE-1 [Elysia marginata]|uniref:Retrovirus-related Pol polyprotein LINE-1 n=1 Tax=Elysia marginata TaxID=1093978 RepID=A0AAV4FK23_9GAST|nr:retrovirus-related Pol polyprotein LINE-1 [Elysia marginata]
MSKSSRHTCGPSCCTAASARHISQEIKKRLLAVNMWFLERIFRILWTEENKVLRLAETDRSLLRLIRKRQMECFGYINRHDGLEKLTLMLHGKVEGRRARGRQRQTFIDSLLRFINTSNKSLSK